MKTVMVECARVGHNYFVKDLRSKESHQIGAVKKNREAEIHQFGSQLCVEAELLERDGYLLLVRIPGGKECWVRRFEEAA